MITELIEIAQEQFWSALALIFGSASLIPFAVIVWMLTEFFKRPFSRLPEEHWFCELGPWLISLILGELCAILFRIDVFCEIGFIAAHEYLGYALGGILIAAFAIGVNEIMKRWTAKRKIVQVEAEKIQDEPK